MEPRIQYAQTADGVSIAYCALGEGVPLVFTPHPAFSHIQSEWQLPGAGPWYERLAEERMVVRYDGRGTGLSDRDVTDFSLDTFMLDLEAVVTNLGLKRFALFGVMDGGPVCIAYAASHPERVSHLVLWCSYAGGSDLRGTPQAETSLALMDKDWVIYTETMAHMMLGWSAGEGAQRLAAWARESVTRETARSILNVLWEWDVTALLPQVRAPTLVLHRREFYHPGIETSKRLASRIPDGRLAVLAGGSPLPYHGEAQTVLEAVDEFLGEGEEASAGAVPSGLVTILFTDMEGSTTLTQRLGDAKAQEVLRTHNTIVRDALKAHSGSEIKHTGDGIMASFTSATRALECAIAMQRAFAEHSEAAAARPSAGSGRAEAIRLRIGLNAGEPVAEDDPEGRADLFGTAVQLAARICAHAEPGQILASNVVQELAAGKDFTFVDQGDVALKGFEKPVRLFEVRWGEEGGP